MTATGPLDERELNRPEHFEHVIAGSRKRLFAIFDDPRQGLAAIRSLPADELIPGERNLRQHTRGQGGPPATATQRPRR
jgi:hypothetical protein